MKNSIMISVIVPAFNSGKHIKKCLKSLSHQTLHSVEIIVVNDGSTDRTSEIAKKCAAKYQNITVIDQENKGVSAARNAGLSIATGEYVTFCDADDYLDKDMYRVLYEHSDGGKIDIVCCGYSRDIFCFHSRVLPPFEENIVYGKEWIKDYILSSFCKDSPGPAVGNIVCKLFNRSILANADISFPEDWNHAEDLHFTMETLKAANNITFVPQAYYHYVKHPSEITLSSKFRPDYYSEEMKYLSFLKSEIAPIIGYSFDCVETRNLIISKACTNASALFSHIDDTLELKKYLKVIFDSSDYRKALCMPSEEEIIFNFPEEKNYVQSGLFDNWKQKMLEVSSQKDTPTFVSRVKRFLLSR